jgi:bifunctional ADP-heptose synthase (sugar kinase/adenylyltransferase)
MKNRILVIGDSCRDVFVYCAADRMCPDKPVPVLKVLDQSENPGMARNTFENIKSIHKNCDILTNENWYDVTKTRYVHKSSNHTFLRIDSANKINQINLKEIKLSNYDLIVISDYDKGFLTEDDIIYISKNHPCTFLDSKKILGKWAEKITYIKINNHEYDRSHSNLTPILESKIIKTMGGDGCVFQGKIFPAKKVEVIDLSGAGDSFMAALVCNFIKTKDITMAIKFANKCACKVVQQKGMTLI